MRYPCPCKGCSDRFPACHATCAKYYAWGTQARLQKDAARDRGAEAYAFRKEQQIKREKRKRED